HSFLLSEFSEFSAATHPTRYNSHETESTMISLRSSILLLSLLAPAALAAAPPDLAVGFASPPPSAKPHTWWHWLNGNISKPGITLDLEAMQRVGIGGVHLAMVGPGIAQGPVAYDSPEMIDCVKFAI